MTRSWKALVLAGKDLVEEERRLENRHRSLVTTRTRLRWAWADLALEVEPMSASGADKRVGERLLRFIEETGCPYTVKGLRDARGVAAAWPPAMREPTVSFEVHTHLMTKQHFMKPGLTTHETEKLLGRKIRKHTPRPYQPSLDRVATVLMNEDLVARLLVEFPETRAVIARALAGQPKRRFLSSLRAA